MSAVERLIGRDPVLAVLRAALDAACDGWGRVVLVAGEPGIGRTALAAELAREATGRGAQVLWGQCWEGDGVPAYRPWAQVLRGASAGPAEDLGGPGPEAPDPEATRFALFDAVAGEIGRLAADRPVVVMLDDLQWVDEASLALLEFATRHLQASPVLLVGAYRDVEAGDRLRRVTGAAQPVQLGGLDAAGVGR